MSEYSKEVKNKTKKQGQEAVMAHEWGPLSAKKLKHNGLLSGIRLPRQITEVHE